MSFSYVRCTLACHASTMQDMAGADVLSELYAAHGGRSLLELRAPLFVQCTLACLTHP